MFQPVTGQVRFPDLEQRSSAFGTTEDLPTIARTPRHAERFVFFEVRRPPMACRIPATA